MRQAQVAIPEAHGGQEDDRLVPVGRQALRVAGREHAVEVLPHAGEHARLGQAGRRVTPAVPEPLEQGAGSPQVLHGQLLGAAARIDLGLGAQADAA